MITNTSDNDFDTLPTTTIKIITIWDVFLLVLIPENIIIIIIITVCDL